MKTDEKLSVKIIRKVVFISIVLVCLFTVGVMASKNEINTVTIVFPEGCTTSVVTSKVKISDILAENHIILLPDEEVYPSEDSTLGLTKTIAISKITEEKKVISEQVESISTEQILGEYVTITEKIITEQIEIPYETITKDVSAIGTETQSKVMKKGVNGLKEVKSKVKYREDVEIERVVISEKILKEPVNKIVKITTHISSRSGGNRATYSSEDIAASVAGIEPEVKKFNTSAYCSCAKCCGKSNGITSSGAPATEWYTVAAGSEYPVGTVIYVPALADKPNGGWFVVQDRGGAISNNKLDIYMGSHAAAILYGRRNVECYIYKFE